MPRGKSSEPMVKWSEDERHAFIHRLAEVMHLKGERVANHKLANIVAQEEGHGYRRRKDFGPNSSVLYKKFLITHTDEIAAQLKILGGEAPPPIPPIPETPLPTPPGPTTLVFWKPEEERAVCAKLVRDEIMLGKTIDHFRMGDLCGLSGYGWRPKTKPTKSVREEFLQRNRGNIEELRKEIGAQWVNHKIAYLQKLQGELQEEAAPPQEIEQEEPQPQLDPESLVKPHPEPVAAAPAPAPTPAPTPAPRPTVPAPAVRAAQPIPYLAGVDLILSGLKMLVGDFVREVVREEVQNLGTPNVNLQPILDRIQANEERTGNWLASLEAMLNIRKMTGMSPLGPGAGIQAAPVAPVAPAPAPVVVPGPPPKKRPVVVVLGGMSPDWEPLKRAFDGKVDFRFYSDKMPVEADPDLCVAFGKYVSHTATKVAKRKYGDKFMAVHGGVTPLRLAIAQRLGIQIFSMPHAN